jgi:hypothetical protein
MWIKVKKKGVKSRVKKGVRKEGERMRKRGGGQQGKGGKEKE